MVFLPGAPTGLPLPYFTALCLGRVAACGSRGQRARGHRLLSAALDAGAHQGHQVAPELDRVLQRVESANQYRAGAGVVVVQERFGDLLRGADQRSGTPGRAGGPAPRRSSTMRSRMERARAQAFSSVAPRIGRTETLKRGTRPGGAAARTSAIERRMAATGSPQSAYTSQCRAPTARAGPEAPPK